MSTPFKDRHLQTRDRDAFIENTDDLGTDRRVQVMNPSTSPVPVSFAASNKTTPSIYNVAAATAGTEYSQALSASTKAFTIQARGNSRIQIAFITGQTNTNFMTIAPGDSREFEGLLLSSSTIYFECSKSSETVEILEWT